MKICADGVVRDATPEEEAEILAEQGLDPVPAEVSAFQARAALIASGFLNDVEAAVAAAPPIVQAAWEYATTFERGSPTITALGAAIGLSDADLDDLFREAAKIRA